jgi:hypothetical protein
MWWLGLLYRRPAKFKEALAILPKGRQWAAAGELLLHVLPYLLAVSLVWRAASSVRSGPQISALLSPLSGLLSASRRGSGLAIK